MSSTTAFRLMLSDVLAEVMDEYSQSFAMEPRQLAAKVQAETLEACARFVADAMESDRYFNTDGAPDGERAVRALAGTARMLAEMTQAAHEVADDPL